MKTSMKLKKVDLLTDSLEQFWGKGAATKVPAIQVDITPQDIITPTENVVIAQPQIASTQDSYDAFQDTGGSIKQAVEQASMGPPDLTPDPRAINQGSGVNPLGITDRPQQQARPKSPYDIGGFDEMISKQMSYERGAFGITPSGGFGGQNRLSEPERLAREKYLFQTRAQRQTFADQRRYTALAMQNYARESRAKQNISSQIVRNYREAANKQRAQAGLPVYESPWDIIAGGKRVIKKKDKAGNETQEIQRYGGVFGAAREVAPGFKKAGSAIKGVTKKTGKGISDFYDKGYEKIAKYNANQKMNDLSKTINQEMDKYTDKPTSNKFTIVPERSHRAPKLGFNDDHYANDTASSINEAMEDIYPDKKTKDLRDV